MINDIRSSFFSCKSSLDGCKHRADGVYGAVDVGVDAAHQADEDDAKHTQDETGALGPMTLDGGNHAVVLTQEHGLDHEQVVVQRDDRVDQRDEYQHVDGHRTLMVKASQGLVLNNPL